MNNTKKKSFGPFIKLLLAIWLALFSISSMSSSVMEMVPSMPGKDFFHSNSFQHTLKQETSDLLNIIAQKETSTLFELLNDNCPISIYICNMTDMERFQYLHSLYEKKDSIDAQMELSSHVYHIGDYGYYHDDESDSNLIRPSYSKKDLLAWAKEGISRNQFRLRQTMVTDERTGRSRTILEYVDSEYGAQGNEGMNDTFTSEEGSDQEYVFDRRFIDMELIEEEANPIGYSSLLEYVNSNNVEYDSLRYDIELTLALPFIKGEEVQDQKMITNLGYWIESPLSGRVYENIQEGDFQSEAWTAKIVKNIGSQIDIESGDLEEVIRDFAYSFDNPLQLADSWNIQLSVNKNLEKADLLKNNASIYPKMQMWFWISLSSAGVFSILSLVFFFFYLRRTRYREENFLKKMELFLPSEVFFLALIAMIFLGAVVVFHALSTLSSYFYIGNVHSVFYWPFWRSIIEASMYTLGAGLIIYFLSALVRKHKEGVLFHRSIFVRFFKKINFFFWQFHHGAYLKHQMLFRTLLLMGGGILLLILGLVNRTVLIFLWCIIGLVWVIREEGQKSLLWKIVDSIDPSQGQMDVDLNDFKGEYRNVAEKLSSLDRQMDLALETNIKNERMQTELITNVSHDIRTPITSILSYTQLLQAKDLTEEQRQEYLAVLNMKAQRLKRMMNDLIDVSKASSGVMDIHLQRISFNEVVVQMIGEYENTWKEKNLELCWSLTDESLYIDADGNLLFRVLDNLLNNAKKYSQPNTRVYLDVRSRAGLVVFELKNTSRTPLNMTSEELLERFRRGDRSRSTDGSGLGLSIAENFVRLMKGNLSIEIDGDLFKVLLTFDKKKMNDSL